MDKEILEMTRKTGLIQGLTQAMQMIDIDPSPANEDASWRMGYLYACKLMLEKLAIAVKNV